MVKCQNIVKINFKKNPKLLKLTGKKKIMVKKNKYFYEHKIINYYYAWNLIMFTVYF